MHDVPLEHHDEPLVGRFVRLEPMREDHVGRLWAAASEDRASFGWTFVPDSLDAMRAYVASAIALRGTGLAVPYATVRISDDRIVGSTRFGNVERWAVPPGDPLVRPSSVPHAVEIGWTWLAPSVQRTHVNTEAKRMMLALAFEVWCVHRVALRTDARNARSRANIERVGGRLDGILRAHTPASDGGVRNTATYSILPDEWPAIRERLDASLAR